MITLSSTTKTVASSAGVTFTASLGAFVQSALYDIAIWLIVMFMVIFVDLLMAIYKIVKVRERKVEHGIELTKDDCIRISKGLRDTMTKSAAYFAFVVTMVFMSQASGIDNLHIWACLLICASEGLSIVGNLCKAKGYSFDEIKFISWATKKASLPGNIITKEQDAKASATVPSASPEVTTVPSASPEVTTVPSASPEVTTVPSASPEVTTVPSASPEVANTSTHQHKNTPTQ